jgi:GNAT superfamily N-acetyltransferase
MRANEFLLEEINDDLLNTKFRHSQVIGDFTYKAESYQDHGTQYLGIICYDGNKNIGEAYFRAMPDGYYISGSTHIEPEYRNKGIASTMYAYVKMLGGDIMPSDYQSKAGKGMWSAWSKTGDDKHLAPEKER